MLVRVLSAEVLLCGTAVVAWVWLVRVARVEWPHLKRTNDALGLSTPRHVRALVAARRWFVPVGGLAAVAAGIAPEARAGIAAGALAVAAVAMWFANEKTRRLLLRSSAPVVRGPGGWDDPDPDAPSGAPCAPRPRPPALGHAATARTSPAEVR
jgi:hypothetical protein